MCLGCLDDDEPPATRREFLATALQLTAASALGATAVLALAIYFASKSLRNIDVTSREALAAEAAQPSPFPKAPASAAS